MADDLFKSNHSCTVNNIVTKQQYTQECYTYHLLLCHGQLSHLKQTLSQACRADYTAVVCVVD